MGHREKVFIDGKEAASVTTILSVVRKEFLERWRGKLGNAECDRIVRESQDLGQNVHSAIECYFRGDEIPELSKREAEMFALFKGWALESRFNPTELELHVQSEEHLYHGTMDTIGHFGDGVLLLGDWKTSSAIDDLYALQLSAYAQAFKEETGVEITEGFVLRVDKKPDSKKPIEFKRFSNLPMYFDVFLSCKDIYDFTKKKGKYERA